MSIAAKVKAYEQAHRGAVARTAIWRTLAVCA